MKILIGIICFVLWSLVSIHWYVCEIKYLCDDDNVENVDTNKIAQTPVSNDDEDLDTTSAVNDIDTTAAKVETESPKTEEVKPVNTFSIEKMGIHFDFAKTSANVSKAQKDDLRTVVNEVKAADATLLLVGHADCIGPADRNVEIGQMRADWLKNLLVSIGLDAKQIITKSVGESESKVITNTSDRSEGREDRRVDVIVKPNNE